MTDAMYEEQFDDFSPTPSSDPAPVESEAARPVGKKAKTRPVKQGKRRRVRRVKKQDVADSIRSLAMMLTVQRGELLPVLTLADQYAGTKIGAAYERVGQRIQEGVPFAVAFGEEDTFPAVARRLVGVGARTGSAGPHLRKAADLLDESLDTAAKVRSALLEPTVLGVGIVIFFIAMVTWAVPQMVEVFASMGAELPALSQLALTISGILQIVIPAVVISGLVAWVWWRKVGRKSEPLRARLDRALLRIPLLGSLRRDAAIANSMSVLEALIGLGIPERDALITAADGSDNRAYGALLREHAQALTAGEVRFADLADGDLFPLAVGNVLEAAASSGSLAVGLEHIADVYRRSASVKANNLSTAIGPAANVVVGALFFGAVLVVYLPMYSMFTAVTSF